MSGIVAVAQAGGAVVSGHCQGRRQAEAGGMRSGHCERPLPRSAEHPPPMLPPDVNAMPPNGGLTEQDAGMVGHCAGRRILTIAHVGTSSSECMSGNSHWQEAIGRAEVLHFTIAQTTTRIILTLQNNGNKNCQINHSTPNLIAK